MRWTKKLESDTWDLQDLSRRPKKIHFKITRELEDQVIKVRQKTGFGSNKLVNYFEISESSIKRILNKNKLTKKTKPQKKRIKYIRFQRDHPNSLWQIDHSDQKIENKWVISVIDDCSRYSIGMFAVNSVTTTVVTKLLDDLIKKFCKPRQILSDNGSAYGLKSKHSRFDRWCRRRGIEHIRSAVHSPTTCGKIERLFQTLKRELPICKFDLELFRYRYNHFRPHRSLDNKVPSEIYNKFTWG